MSASPTSYEPTGLTGRGGGTLPYRFLGTPASQILRVPANVVAAQTVTVGQDVYRVAAVATAAPGAAAVIGNELNNTLDENTFVSLPAHGLIVGDLLRCQNEIMVVIGVPSANALHLRRGVSNTTIATHAAGQAYYTEASPGGAGIAIGHNATFTPTVFNAALIADINSGKRPGMEQITAKALTINSVLCVYCYTSTKRGSGIPAVSTSALSTTETLAGASNAWDAATFTNGIAPYMQQTIRRTPTALEVTAGTMIFSFPFIPLVVEKVIVQTTSTLALKVHDGVTSIDGYDVLIDNSGATDWAATDVVEIRVRG